MRPGVRLDLHIHSDRSPDSHLGLDVIVAKIRAAGLQGFALTDHNTVAGHPALRELATSHPDLLLVPGVEVSTAAGHLLAYGVDAVPPVHLTVGETVAWVRAHGGEPVLAHPFRRFHGVGRTEAETADVRALESRNGQNSERANRAAERLAGERGLGMTGGSDAHTVAGIGRAYTTLPELPATIDDLLGAIRGGRTLAGGSSLGLAGRLRWGLRNAWLRTGRGFRGI
jgi:hypothetical protein